MAQHRQDHEWFGLCAVTESNRPHEWPFLIHVMKNRLNDRRWPNTGAAVVLQPWQFSYFNQFKNMQPWEVFQSAQQDWRRVDRVDLEHAVACAEWCIYNDVDPTGGCDHYWSPRSMLPALSAPTWAADGGWVTMPGVDPKRFTFMRSSS